MPVWQQEIKKLGSNNLVVIGVVQEQHSERTQLYRHWKQFEFPIVQDPITQNGIAVVPVFVGIDEYGIVQSTRLRPNGLSAFVAKKTDKPAEPAPKLDGSINHREIAEQENHQQHWVDWGDQELLFRPHGGESLDNAISAYSSAVKLDPENGAILFRLGVAYRMRYDEESHADEDFDNASQKWSEALASNPNQYIWRRRIQQYGPRLDKPYPFYDWVEQAISDIEKRGETPIELKVPLTQSELAGRSRPSYSSDAENPDPTGKIIRDEGQYIQIQSTTVPAMVAEGKPTTIHFRLVPKEAKWNNESTPLTIWIHSEDADLTAQLLQFDNPEQATSSENRNLELDLMVKKGATECTVAGFALYNVCLEDGTCVYRRQDFSFNVPFETNQE